MLKTFLGLLVIILTANYLPGSDLKYPISEIPEDLFQHADAIIREYKIVKTIHSVSDIETREYFVITIFNKSAEKLGFFQEYYDSDIKLSNYSVKTYNKFGRLETKTKPKDFEYNAAYQNFILFSDNKVLYYNTINNNYPYTVEISFTKRNNSSLFLGNWYPAIRKGVAVQKASFILETNPDFEFRYKEFNLKDSVIIKEIEKKKVYSWSINNFKAIKDIPYMPSYANYMPMVKLAPNSFEFDGYAGNLSSWKKFGEWNWNLIKNQDIIDTVIINEIKELTKNCKTDEDKIRTLYSYLQNNTRYVNVSLGIGGFKPFHAQTVHENKYGDCKALSNYMRSILKIVGIDSYYTLIKSSNTADIDASFPSQQMNHAILCVPNNSDTIWLECTSQKIPLGFIGKGNQNKTVLLVTPQGGKLVKTPKYSKNANTEEAKTHGSLDSLGNIKLNYTTRLKALQYNSYRNYFYLSKEEQKKQLYEDFSLPRLKINSFTIFEERAKLPTISFDVNLEIDNYAKENGGRLLFNPNILNQFSYIPRKIKNRKYKLKISLEYIDTDTVKFNLPNNYFVEYLPDTTLISTKFGTYQSSFEVNNNILTYIRHFERNSGTFPPEDYNDFRDFLKAVSRADNKKIALKKEKTVDSILLNK